MVEDLGRMLDRMIYDIAVYVNADTPRKTAVFMQLSLEFLEYLNSNKEIISGDLLNDYSGVARRLAEEINISRRRLQAYNNRVRHYNIEETLDLTAWEILWRDPSLKQYGG